MIGAALGGIISDALGRKIIFVGAVTITTGFKKNYQNLNLNFF